MVDKEKWGNMRSVITKMKNGDIFFYEEEPQLTKEQAEEITSVLKKCGVLKFGEEVSLVETMVCYTVHKRGN